MRNFAPVCGNCDGDARPAPDEYATKGAGIGKKMQEQSEKNIKDIEGVLLPDQLKRLKGIAVQRMVAMGMTGGLCRCGHPEGPETDGRPNHQDQVGQ